MAATLQPNYFHSNGADLAYVEKGRGVPVVFVHGSLSDYRSWGAQLAEFSEHHHAIAYSRRHHWPNTQNTQPNDNAAYAATEHIADLATLIASLGLAPVHLIGSSYGALMALALAVERPDLVRSLVLGEPPLLSWLLLLPDGPALLEAFMTTAFVPAGQALAQGEMEEGVRLFLNGVLGANVFDRLPAPARESILDNAATMRLETSTPPDLYFPVLSADDVSRLRAPMLLVQGEMSPPMFRHITNELARILPEAERVMIPAASHRIHGENPAAYNAAVLNFIAAH